MSKIVVSVWMTLDGVFDADIMDQWFNSYHSADRAAYIQGTIEAADALLLGRTTYEMLAPYWSTQKTDENGPASKLNSIRKYVVSSTMKEIAVFPSNCIQNISIFLKVAMYFRQLS